MKYETLKNDVKKQGAVFVGSNDLNRRFYTEAWAGESGTYLLIHDKFQHEWDLTYHRTEEGIQRIINQLNQEGVTV